MTRTETRTERSPSARAARARVLVVDDKLAMAETLADGLVDRGFDAGAEASASAAIDAARAGRADVIVTDLRMPGVDGLELVEAVRASKVDVPVIVMTAYGAIDSAVESIRKGAYHYLTKPFKVEELAIFVQRALDERALRREAAVLRRSLAEHFSVAGVIAQSPGMQRVLNVVERVGPSDVAVLIHGETGAGKGLIARVLHGASKRASRPFVAINCAALPETLLESELFGHMMGSFTGATGNHDGLFAGADGGTVLLDEIAEIPIGLQAKLLRVLEAGRVRPVGAVRERAVDVRILAATHRDLRRAVAEGTFREDLLYRLDVVSIEVPPLRQRRDDIAPLVEGFLAKARDRHPSSAVERVSRGALQRMLDYGWPGNVRELEHAIERGVLLATGAEIQEGDLGLLTSQLDHRSTFTGEVVPLIEMQRRYARWALDELGGHKTRTAEKLDIDIKTLNRLLASDAGADGKVNGA